LANVSIGQLTDVTQAILSRRDFDEGPEILDGTDPAVIDFAELGSFGDLLDHFFGRLGAFAADAGDGHTAVVLDFDIRAGGSLDLFDRCAAWADDFADLLGVDFDVDEIRGVWTGRGPRL